ncbi:avidin family protein [Mycena belliarum]|uniref:Avidin family protein n=1 Tax=Mycena belliarum TaxID=1033014 RepID=A0AAD6U146_9AGAR|nr:avidin family protein [Mycena belliae]
MGISGEWYNELGSKMTLIVEGGGGLSGKYNSAVGEAEDFYVLAGRFDSDPPADEGISLGWVVTYRNKKLNANSTAAWSGQYFGGDGGERIITNWLLTSSTAADSVWNSTRVGNDTFMRKKPSVEEIAQARASKFCSPHPEDVLARK